MTFSTPIHVAGQARDSFGQSRCIKSSGEFRRQAILTVLYLHPAEHHFRVSNEVFVDLNLSACCLDSGQLGPGFAGRCHFRRPLLKEENVGCDFRSRICFECRIGES